MRSRQPIQTLSLSLSLSLRPLVLTWNKNNIGFDSVHDPSVAPVVRLGFSGKGREADADADGGERSKAK